MELNSELFYTDLRKFSAQSYKRRALLILPTPAPEAPECVFVAYAYKIPAAGHAWGFELGAFLGILAIAVVRAWKIIS